MLNWSWMIDCLIDWLHECQIRHVFWSEYVAVEVEFFWWYPFIPILPGKSRGLVNLCWIPFGCCVSFSIAIKIQCPRCFGASPSKGGSAVDRRWIGGSGPSARRESRNPVADGWLWWWLGTAQHVEAWRYCFRLCNCIRHVHLTYGPHKAVAEVSNHNEPIGRKSGIQLVRKIRKSMDFTFSCCVLNWLTD